MGKRPPPFSQILWRTSRVNKYKILKILGVGGLVVCFAVCLYAWRNLNYDYTGQKFMEKEGVRLGFKEKTYWLEGEREIYYLEGPDNGPELVLLHGQMVDSKDYHKVLPELSKHFHVFAPDYYGHGKSSKKAGLYNIKTIGDDLASFIKERVKATAILSGHSSGALITAYVAAFHPDQVKGIVLEDGPFFSTEKGRAEDTFSYIDFKNINDYLTNKPNMTYFEYSVKNNPMKMFFNKEGKDHWSQIVAEPALKKFKKDPSQLPVIWYYPPELGINRLLQITANQQDGTGDYDLQFGKSFYDFSFFSGLDQEAILRQIKCPTFVLHVAPPKETAPSYYTSEGWLISAMDEQDAHRVKELIEGSTLIEGFQSMHDIHDDLPKEYVKTLLDFKQSLNIKSE
ncbi:alpha/beta hydrolase [Facklamia sp. DSM 111018]|uniref:Alpha/beta hydrolase n=1 Tax=Facklamia lactis TaxID=2749967 RepID=A0ABS0LPV2_9LACT|nr:alpha/beta hydrolase [Facklamia lactis]